VNLEISKKEGENMLIKDGMTVLFQGDSITDCGRKEDAAEMGNGYAARVASDFTAKYPHLNVKFINRGISGNRACDLAARWNEDCIALEPDIVSILIGINDVWRRYDSNDPTSVEAFKSEYHGILSQVKAQTNAKIIICEPFVLPVPEDRTAWREDLDPKIQAARELAREFGAIYIPLDGIFAAASTRQASEIWADDGVHPTQAGHALIANAWLSAAEKE